MKLIYVTKDEGEYNAFETVVKNFKLPVVIDRYTSGNKLFDYLYTLGNDEQLPDAVMIDANPEMRRSPFIFSAKSNYNYIVKKNSPQ